MADSSQASSIIANPKISAVTLTGSTNAGKAVAKLAGENLKKSVLELGGSDPYIILKDADLDLAVEKCVTSRMINNGQSCIAAKRFIVESDIYDEFYSKFKAKMAEYKFGDPLDENTKLGPLAGLEHKKTVCEIVNETGYDNVYDFEGGLEEWFGKDQMEQAEVSNNQKSRKVKDIMSENVDYIEPDTSLKEVAKKMTDSGTGSFAIGNGDKLVGFITDRDIVTRAVAEGKDINETKVKEIMTENVLYCFENDSLEEIADNMKNNEVLRLIVLDKDKNFVGMVTHSDLSKAISDKDDKLNNKVAELASFREAA
jgi:CBS domain-containing protein